MSVSNIINKMQHKCSNKATFITALDSHTFFVKAVFTNLSSVFKNFTAIPEMMNKDNLANSQFTTFVIVEKYIYANVTYLPYQPNINIKKGVYFKSNDFGNI